MLVTIPALMIILLAMSRRPVDVSSPKPPSTATLLRKAVLSLSTTIAQLCAKIRTIDHVIVVSHLSGRVDEAQNGLLLPGLAVAVVISHTPAVRISREVTHRSRLSKRRAPRCLLGIAMALQVGLTLAKSNTRLNMALNT
jgi:hypothetical protein